MINHCRKSVINKEVNQRCSANKALKKLRQNLEDLSAVLESNYTVYLNPKIIARMQDILGRKNYDDLHNLHDWHRPILSNGKGEITDTKSILR